MGNKRFLAAVLTIVMVMSFIPATVMAATKGWNGNSEVGWSYYKNDTEYCQSEWLNLGGKWYYFDANGIAAQNKWVNVGGKLYYFNSDCVMQKNKWIDCGPLGWYVETPSDNEFKNKRQWRYVGSDGAAYTGWKKVGGVWYYFYAIEDTYESSVGYMAYSWFWDESTKKWYNFDGNGRYRKNVWYMWDYEDDDEVVQEWYYFGSDGLTTKGWKQISKKWYYFDDHDHYMYTGPHYIGDKLYYFAASGAMQTGWQQPYLKTNDDPTYYYFGSDGAAVTENWVKYKGSWYYMDQDGEMIADIKDYFINGLYYDFNANGVCTNPYSGRNAVG